LQAGPAPLAGERDLRPGHRLLAAARLDDAPDQHRLGGEQDVEVDTRRGALLRPLGVPARGGAPPDPPPRHPRPPTPSRTRSPRGGPPPPAWGRGRGTPSPAPPRWGRLTGGWGPPPPLMSVTWPRTSTPPGSRVRSAVSVCPGSRSRNVFLSGAGPRQAAGR